MLGLMQRTKKGLEALSVAIRACRESWNTDITQMSYRNTVKKTLTG